MSALPKFTGGETSGALSMPISLNYQIQDPAGSIVVVGQTKYDQAEPMFTYTGAWWVDPPSTTGYPEQCRAAAARASWSVVPHEG